MAASRLEELRRRVKADPASVAFAALAEELRRAGLFEEAIATARKGLQRHPGFVSGHVTLGRSLLAAGHPDDARSQLEFVLGVAPENLVALRTLGEVHEALGNTAGALDCYRKARDLAPQDPGLASRLERLEAQSAAPGSGPSQATRVATPEASPPVLASPTLPEDVAAQADRGPQVEELARTAEPPTPAECVGSVVASSFPSDSYSTPDPYGVPEPLTLEADYVLDTDFPSEVDAGELALVASGADAERRARQTRQVAALESFLAAIERRRSAHRLP
jgi:tetratricopeptide (TPR) repeat protein